MAKEELPPTATTIVFHDGEKVIYTENILVDSTMGFKHLQSAITKRIGVAHHQITLALVTGDPNTAAANLSAHKLPLKAVFHEPSAYLIALLHPSPARTSRRRRRHSPEKPAAFPAPEKVLLRRYPAAALPVSDFGRHSPTPAQRLPDDVLTAAQRKRFLRHYGPPPTLSLLKSDTYTSAPPPSMKEEKAVCEVCEKAKGGPAPEFHPCVNDRVMSPMEFRYDYGPTQRPGRARIV